MPRSPFGRPKQRSAGFLAIVIALTGSGCGPFAHGQPVVFAEPETARAAVPQLVTSLSASVDDAEEGFIAALSGDLEALEGILAEDFLYSTALGTTIDKQALLAHLRSGQTRLGKIRRENVRKTSSAGVVVTTGSLVGDLGAAGEAGRSITRRSRYLHVWIPTPEGWRLLARQTSSPTEEIR